MMSAERVPDRRDRRYGPRWPIDGVVYRPAAEAERHVAQGDWIDGSIGDAVRSVARVRGHAPAIIGPDGTLTFAALDQRSESVAACLLDLGLLPGDRVLFQLGTCGAFFVAFFGCLKAGLVPVCTLPQHRRHEMTDAAARTGARAIIVQADVTPRFDQLGFATTLAAGIDSIAHVIAARGTRAGCGSLEAMAEAFDADAARARTRGVAPTFEDVALFQLSGGSGGRAKIVPRMHGEYLGASRQLGRRYRLTAADVTLWSLPLIHNAGMLFAVLPLVAEGRTLVVQPRADVAEMLRLIAEHRVTFTGSIGPIAARLLASGDLGGHDLSSLRQFFTLSRADALERRLGVPVGQMFGMTEGAVFAAPPEAPAAIRHHTVGYPVSHRDEVRLLVPGEDRAVAFGEIGELCFRGPSTLGAYYGDPPATAAGFTADGYFRSGDLMRAAMIAGRVCYIFEGRIKDMIDRGGEKIGAEELEELIGRHPDVSDARVVAMPDPILGEKICAFVIASRSRRCPTVAELGAFLTGLGLARYKLPERVEAIGQFPLTGVGKTDKAALRAIAANAFARENAPAAAGGHRRA